MRAGVRVPARDGAARIARRVANAVIVPCAIRYEFFERARPYAWLKCLTPLTPPDGANALDRHLDDACRRLDEDLKHGSGAYEPLARASTGTILIRNVPVDVGRVAHALDIDVVRARSLFTGGTSRSERAAAVGTVSRECGALYGELIRPDSDRSAP